MREASEPKCSRPSQRQTASGVTAKEKGQWDTHPWSLLEGERGGWKSVFGTSVFSEIEGMACTDAWLVQYSSSLSEYLPCFRENTV